jgi:hypothetical protein
VAIQQRLQDDHHVGLGDSRRSLHHDRLVELINRAVGVVKPTHDRGGHHGPDAVIDHIGHAVGENGHLGQPGHGLLDEDVARPTEQTSRARPGHHLHRRDTVPAQVEERVVHPDPFDTENLGVDAGQNLLDRVCRRAVVIGVLVLGCRQGARVELAVDRQRQRLQDHHRGGHHIRR